MRKRGVVWLLGLAAVLTLTGCGGKGAAETAAADQVARFDPAPVPGFNAT